MAKVKGKGKERKEQGGLLAEGDYRLKIFNDEKVKISTGGSMLTVEFIGADKKVGKRHFWNNYCLWHKDETVAERAQNDWDHLVFCSLGEGKTSKKSEDLHEKELMAHIVVRKVTKKEKKKGWKDKNEIQYLFPVDEKKEKKGKNKPF